MKTKLNIFEYIDYKKYLSDWRELEKKDNPGLTHEYICTKLGIRNNRSYFNNIEKGRKEIGPEMLRRLVMLLELKNDEANYFRALVGYGQWTTYEEREFWFEQLVQLNNTPKKIIDEKTYNYYKNWYYPTIRSYLDTCDFKDQYTEASRKHYNRVSPNQIKEAIKNLLELGLIASDEHGYLKSTDRVVTTGDVVKNDIICRYHIANIDMLRKILEINKPGTHESSQTTVAVSEEGMKRIIKRINQLQSEIRSIVHKDEKKSDRVYKILIHLYPETLGSSL